MQQNRRGEKPTHEKHILNVGMLLGCLEVPAEVNLISPAVLVSFVKPDLLSILMRTRLWAAKHSWTDELITGLTFYADYQKDELDTIALCKKQLRRRNEAIARCPQNQAHKQLAGAL